MHADAVLMNSPSGAESQPKARLKTLAHLDRRTRASRRAAALAEAFAAELGGEVSEAEQVRVETAAALSVIAEDAQARRLAGDQSVSLDDLVRAASAARRAVRDLGIDHRKPRNQGASLAEYLAARNAGQPEEEDEPEPVEETAAEAATEGTEASA